MRYVVMLLAIIPILAAAPPAVAQSPAPCAIAAAAALAQAGKPYVWGAKGPDQFDCSGLIYWSWLQAGYNVGISSYDQARAGVQISCGLGDLAGAASNCWQAGDLIMLRYTGGQHVAMYIGDGLFADAYNPSTGVIIHDVASDQFYWDTYWQSRRIVSCDGVSVDPGAPSSAPLSIPGLEDLPDLLATVSFSVPQCGNCNFDGGTILPTSNWDGHWPSNPLDVAGMVQASISWLSWRISEMLRLLICWLLSMLALLAGFLARLANVVVYGINGLWKLALLFWFALQGWVYLLEDVIAAVLAARDLLMWIAGLIIEIIIAVRDLLGTLLNLVQMIAVLIFGAVGWVEGLSLGMILAILAALGGTSVPVQLSGTSEVYRGLHGFLSGIRDSEIGFVLVLFWGACYVGFVVWMAKFFSKSGGGE